MGAIGVLLLGVEAGILLGVGLSLLLFLWRTSRPHIAVVGQVPGSEHFRNVERFQVIESPSVRVIDASTAYRVDPAWTYGFAEMAHAPDRMTQGEKIAGATRVSTPGCYPTGFIGLVRPLVSVAYPCPSIASGE